MKALVQLLLSWTLGVDSKMPFKNGHNINIMTGRYELFTVKDYQTNKLHVNNTVSRSANVLFISAMPTSAKHNVMGYMYM